MSRIGTVTRSVWFTVTELLRIKERIKERRAYEAWLDEECERCENEKLVPFAGNYN